MPRTDCPCARVWRRVEAARERGYRLIALVCVNGGGAVLMPCGRCRQLLWEHGGPNCLVQTPSGIQPMSHMLPRAFDAGDLAGRNDEGE